LSDVDDPDEYVSDGLKPDENSDENPVNDIVHQIPNPGKESPWQCEP
jgi:rhodanese-related sulfurtransferase